jgi:hypothetical protein
MNLKPYFEFDWRRREKAKQNDWEPGEVQPAAY